MKEKRKKQRKKEGNKERRMKKLSSSSQRTLRGRSFFRPMFFSSFVSFSSCLRYLSSLFASTRAKRYTRGSSFDKSSYVDDRRRTEGVSR